MSYLGRQLTSGNYLKLDDLQPQFNGSTKTFNLTSGGTLFYPGSAYSILVVLGGVVQEPESAYTIDQCQITFASAPGASDDFFCIVLGVALGIGVPGDRTVTGDKLSQPFNYNSGQLTLDTTNNGVGIATTSPQAPLHVVGTGATTLLVNGNARITGILTIGTGSITFNGNTNTITGISTISSPSISGVATFSTGPVLIGTATTTGTASQPLQVTGGAYVSGNLGIGTTNPQAQLHITSQLQSTQANSTTTGRGQIYLNGANGNRIDFNTNGVAAPAFTTRSVGTKIVLYPNIGASQVDFALGIDSATLWSSVADSAQQFKWYAGTTNIASLFGTGELVLGTTSKTGTASQPLQVTGGGYVSGNFGVGEASPASKLTVRSDSTGGRGGEISIVNYATSTVGNEAALNFGLENSSYNADNGNAQIKARVNNVNAAADLIFSNWSGSSFNETVRILSNGNLGIGTISPVKTLDVRGEATFGAGVLISDLNWGKDANQLVYTFSGTAGGGNPSDGVIALVSPNANPNNTRIGSIVYGNKVSGTTATTNPGLKAGIDCTTNANVANAADTGAYITFYTKPDNANFRSQMTLNSNGVLTRPYQPAFLAYRATTLSIGIGWQLISSGILTESYDIGSVYSTSTNGRFVAPVAGRYMFYAGGYSVGSTSGERYAFGVKVNNVGSPDYITGGNYCITDTPLAPYQVVLNLAANDYVELHFFSAITTSLGGSTHWIYWGGYLL